MRNDSTIKCFFSVCAQVLLLILLLSAPLGADVRSALNLWARASVKDGPAEVFVRNNQIIIRSFAHDCFSVVAKVNLSDVDIEATKLIKSKRRKGYYAIELHCIGNDACFEVSTGAIWKSKNCKTAKVQRRLSRSFSLSNIPHEMAMAAVRELKK